MIYAIVLSKNITNYQVFQYAKLEYEYLNYFKPRLIVIGLYKIYF